MKQILFISGKGGTGKTTVSAAIADLASKELSLVLADADVDAANLELLLEPTKEDTFSFRAGQVVQIDQDLCNQCGQCEAVCRFDAIEHKEDGTFLVKESFCEGCLSCVHQCPVDAINILKHKSGEWYRSSTSYGALFHANLFPGEENSGKLVTQIKSDAKEYAEGIDANLLLIDGPPGIGCPVTAACQGIDAAIIVSEPTVSGQHDMARVKQVTDHFNIPSFLILNKSDLNKQIRSDMRQYALDANVPLLGEIPYDEEILHAQALGKPITQTLKEPYLSLFSDIWSELQKAIIK